MKEQEITFNQAKVQPKLDNIESMQKQIAKIQNEIEKTKSNIPPYIEQIIQNAKLYNELQITNIDFYDEEDGVKIPRKKSLEKRSLIKIKIPSGFAIDFKLKDDENTFSFDSDSFLTRNTNFHLVSIKLFKNQAKVRMWFSKNENHKDDCDCECFFHE